MEDVGVCNKELCDMQSLSTVTEMKSKKLQQAKHVA